MHSILQLIRSVEARLDHPWIEPFQVTPLIVETDLITAWMLNCEQVASRYLYMTEVRPPSFYGECLCRPAHLSLLELVRLTRVAEAITVPDISDDIDCLMLYHRLSIVDNRFSDIAPVINRPVTVSRLILALHTHIMGKEPKPAWITLINRYGGPEYVIKYRLMLQLRLLGRKPDLYREYQAVNWTRFCPYQKRLMRQCIQCLQIPVQPIRPIILHRRSWIMATYQTVQLPEIMTRSLPTDINWNPHAGQVVLRLVYQDRLAFLICYPVQAALLLTWTTPILPEQLAHLVSESLEMVGLMRHGTPLDSYDGPRQIDARLAWRTVMRKIDS